MQVDLSHIAGAAEAAKHSPEDVLKEAEGMNFDFVIIGGGTAGLVLATRLTEDPAVNVAVLEAGELRAVDPKIVVPGLAATTRGNPDYDWDFKTAPQAHANDRIITWPRGKVVGGSSSINYHVWIKASPSEYDDWEALGNAGWNYKNLAPYFAKVEDFRDAPKSASDHEGALPNDSEKGNGLIKTKIADDMTPAGPKWRATGTEMGLDNIIAGDAPYVGTYQSKAAIDPIAGIRSSALGQYYLPVAHRPNLKLISSASVTRITFSKDFSSGPLVATGVDFTLHGRPHSFTATCEIILCAGTIQSPQILELSGIGSATLLKEHNIPILIDNPAVGENLQDHQMVGLIYEVSDPAYSLDGLKSKPDLARKVMEEYHAAKTGIMAGGPKLGAMLSYRKLDHSSSPPPHIPSGHADEKPGLSKQHSILHARLERPDVPVVQILCSEAYVSAAAPPKRDGVGDCITIVCALAAPFSRGSVHIQSANVSDHPVVDPRYLSDDIDRILFTKATTYAQGIAATEPFKGVLKSAVLPEGKWKWDSDGQRSEGRAYGQDSEGYIRQSVGSCLHPVGTCAMMPREMGGVVDAELRVYGTGNLRVVDASVFPLHISGNIQWTVYVVAERAADLIRKEWERKKKSG